MNQKVVDRVLALVSEALEDLEQRRTPLSAVIQKSIRIARLRNDWDALWWLSLELTTAGDMASRRRLAAELMPHYEREAYRKQNERFGQALIEERTVNRNPMAEDKESPEARGQVSLDSVPELEARAETLTRLQSLSVPQGLHPLDLAVFTKETTDVVVQASNSLRRIRNISDRIRQRAHDFLSMVEKQLLFGQIQADIFERNRRYVDERLTALVPEAAEQFMAAYSRAADGAKEARAHALTSCRRILKTVADKLYPPSETRVRGADGKDRVLDDSKYVARLWQYVHESAGSTSAGKVVLAGIQDLGKRIDSLYELINKGVHADVPEFEANMCVIQTYLLVGDVLRIQEKISAALDP
jgi:hypothetical protein